MKIVAALILTAVLVGCDAKSDMGEQPKLKPMTGNATFADGAAARPLVAGVVPRDPVTVPGNAYTTAVAITPAGTLGMVDEAMRNPRPIDAALLERGHQQFDIYCSACHGRLGNGMGMIAQRGLMHPPSYHVDRLRTAGDGHVYNVISAGYGAMYSLSDKLAPPDRWAVIAYIRALQSAGEGASGAVAQTLHGSGDAKSKTAGYRQ